MNASQWAARADKAAAIARRLFAAIEANHADRHALLPRLFKMQQIEREARSRATACAYAAMQESADRLITTIDNCLARSAA